MAIPVLDPGVAALERAVGMSQLRHPPERVEPFAPALLDGDEQTGPKRSAGMTKLATSAIEPAAKRTRQSLGKLVELLLLRRQQRVLVGPVPKADVKLLAGAFQ